MAFFCEWHPHVCFLPVPFCFTHYASVLYLETGMVILPALLLFFLSICSLLQFHIHFRVFFFLFLWRMRWRFWLGLDWICNWLFVKSSCSPWFYHFMNMGLLSTSYASLERFLGSLLGVFTLPFFSLRLLWVRVCPWSPSLCLQLLYRKAIGLLILYPAR